MNTIFISIASYKDILLEKTINEAYSKAKYPNNLVFGIFEQNYESDSINLDNFAFKNQFKYKRIDPELAKGVCWARQLIQEMYSGEKYFFQIDSHMLFDQDWDEHFISCLEELKKYHNKPLITAYPTGFNPYTFEKGIYRPGTVSIIKTNDKQGRLKKFKSGGYLKGFGKQDHPSKHKMVYGYYIGACCIFSQGIFVEEVPYDDSIFFTGEEPALSIRAWTHGYNIFHISDLHVYHCWTRDYGVRVQEDLAPGQGWANLKRAKKHIQRLIHGEIVGKNGIGTERTTQHYVDFSGINFFNFTWTDRNKNVFGKPYYEPLTI